MSYDIYMYLKTTKEKVEQGRDIDDIEHDPIPAPILRKFKERLQKFNYLLEHKDEEHEEYIHENLVWGIVVNVFNNEIAFSVPYWNDSEKAILEAATAAKELTDTGDLVIFDPQKGGWA